MNYTYIYSLIRKKENFAQTVKGNTYRLVYFEELNKVYVYQMPTSHYNRKYRPKWTFLGILPCDV